MLEIDSVALTFWGKPILSGCYINCKPGEIVGLLGRNGSGKSCLLKIIFGSLKADFKHLRIDDKIVKQGFKTHKIAYLPQENFLPPFIKVSDLIHSIAPRYELRKNELIAKIVDQTVGSLSKGEVRFLECIWILNHQAKYILLDEPFSGLAPIQINFLQEIIRQTGKIKGIILTDHIYHALLSISDRVVLMHNNSVYPIKEERDLIRYNYIPDFS